MSKKKKICRSFEERHKKQGRCWICVQATLVVLVAVYSFVAYPFFHPKVRSLSDAVNYADIEFNGLMLGKKLQKSIIEESEVIDDGRSYLWGDNIRISTDDNGQITHLAFGALESVDSRRDITIDDVNIAYRGHVLRSYSDFEECFGESAPSTNQRYKNYSYHDEKYVVNITTYEGAVRNIEAYLNKT